MLRFSKSKIVATMAIIVIGLLLAVPSLMTREQRQAFLKPLPCWVPSWIVPTRAIVLGLDLQGGSHVLLEVDIQDLHAHPDHDQLRDDVRRILRETRVSPQGGIQILPRGVQVRVPDPAERDRLCRSCANCRSRSATPILGQTRRPRHRDHRPRRTG